MRICAHFGRFFSFFVGVLVVANFATSAPAFAAADENQCLALLKGYRDANEAKTWAEISPFVKNELQIFRALKPDKKAAYLRQVGEQTLNALALRAGSRNLAFHFNLHGGLRDQYSSGGGIIAQMGDVAISYGAARDFHKQVYFFRTQDVRVESILGTKNPTLLFFKERMGNVLVIFNLDAPILQSYRDQKMIIKEESSFLDFDDEKMKRGGQFVGVPSEAFVLPPIDLFKRIAKTLGERGLTWDEETLAAMRFLERYAVNASN